jgi:two-component system, cell cycle sensor histidine kinase and response regulator CckA
MRTLVVEDSRSMRRLLELMLRERGHVVASFGDAEAATAAHREEPFDLLLLDWMLPGKSGLEFAADVRRMPNGDLPVIIVLTGKEGQAQLEAVLDAGANDYIAKPLEPELLRTRLVIAERTVEERVKRRAAEDANRRSERTFRSLTEAVPDGIVVRRSNRIVFANRAIAVALGREELTSIPYEELAHPADHDEIGRPLALVSVLGPDRPTPRERRYMRADGSVMIAEVVSLPIDFEGEPALLEVVRDLTMQRQIQARMQLADRMASVGTLAAGVAHELNNPLAFVQTNLQLIQEELDRLRPVMSPERIADLRTLADESYAGAVRMADIVRDLKTFARAEEDERHDSVDVQPVIESSMNMAYNQVRHRARLHRSFEPTPLVEINESRLGQVIVNLLLNAAEAIPEGRRERNDIHVRTYTDADGWAVIEVRDTGVGIAKETLARMYDPFYTTKTMGVGLGLSICHNIVTGAGGEIVVETELGQGTCFRLRFPPGRSRSEITAGSTQRKGRSAAPRARVLVVDDEPMVGRSLKRALKDHDVFVVTDGNEAIEKILGEHFDVVFCDLMMPEVGGADVYERVMAERPGAEERIVFMTGGAFTPRAREFIDRVPNPQISKPFDIEDLREIVRARLLVDQFEAGSGSGL